MFDLAWPWIFLLAPLPWVLRALLSPADSGEAALQVGFLDELQELSGQQAGGALPGWRQQLPFVLVWLCLLLAAARPQWLGERLPIPASGRDLLVAVDVSGSMDYPDMQWQGQPISRLGLVQQLFGEFIEQRQGDRVGLILFGSQAYLQAPLTFDRRTVRTWLEEAQTGIAGPNTAIGDAIGLAVKRLRDQPADSRVLILITDGANNGGSLAPMTAAQLAADNDITLYTIGIGALPGQTRGPGMFALAPALDLDEPGLLAMAELTGGQYFRAHSSEALRDIGHTLDRLQPVARHALPVRRTHELYAWPLALALLLSLWLVVRVVYPQGMTPYWLRRPRS